MKVRNRKLSGKKKSRIQEFKKNLPLTILALPAMLLIFVFKYIPMYGLILPFKDFDYATGLLKSPWCGFKNFEYLFTNDDVLRATRNTVLYNLVFIVAGMIVALAVALMLFEMSKRVVKVTQTLLLLPFFISYIVVSYAVNGMLDMNNGLLNNLLQALGKEPILWYNEPRYWPAIIVLVAIWKGMGYAGLVYYAALMGTNMELYDAAKVDGASKWKQMWHVSLPSLRPMISIMLILDFGKILSTDFGLFYNVPMNSPLLYETTDVLSTYTYRALMSIGNIGMSSATSFYTSVVGLFLVLLCNWIVRKVSEENALF